MPKRCLLYGGEDVAWGGTAATRARGWQDGDTRGETLRAGAV